MQGREEECGRVEGGKDAWTALDMIELADGGVLPVFSGG